MCFSSRDVSFVVGGRENDVAWFDDVFCCCSRSLALALLLFVSEDDFHVGFTGLLVVGELGLLYEGDLYAEVADGLSCWLCSLN